MTKFHDGGLVPVRPACSRCKHFRDGMVGTELLDYGVARTGVRVAVCKHPKSAGWERGFDVINGAWRHRTWGQCRENRRDAAKCGPEGRWFDAAWDIRLWRRIRRWFPCRQLT